MKRGENGSSACLLPCIILITCYLHFHLDDLCIPHLGFRRVLCSPFAPQVFGSLHKDSNNSLSLRVSNEMPPIVPSQLSHKLLQPLGAIMCVYWFDSQVMLRPHGSAIVAGGRLPSGTGTKTKRLFAPSFTKRAT